jgi:hypothetical protein
VRLRIVLLLLVTLSLGGCDSAGDGGGTSQSSTPSKASPEPQGPLTTDEFITPSGNIWCELNDPWLGCDIGTGLNPEPSSEFCGADWAGLFIEPGRFSGPGCSGDEKPTVSADAPVLEYGETWKHGDIRCRSRSSGLTCKDSSGFGFTLARAGWELLGKEEAAREAFGDLSRDVRAQADLDRPGEVESVLPPDLRFADACGELQEGFAQVEFSDSSHAIYTACFVSGTWHITDGPLYVD